ncbi:MAG: hypothetical protein OES47_11775 [Acidobacteriota bacterium]|nr:hypothetical protein [Acidobacteriota bacterium]
MTKETPLRPRPDQDPLDLDIRGIVGFAVGLSVLILVAAALMWFASSFLRGLEEAKDPPHPVLAEARERPQHSGPLLQEYPLAEMQAFRTVEQEALTSYAWVDRTAGVAAVPIERAMEILAEKQQAAGESPQPEGSSE